MAKENALIKKLIGVETLGSTNVICTDKTGTLTKAEMTVKEMFTGDAVVEVTGAGYEPVGDFVVGDTTLPKDEARRRLELLMRAMTFCNDAKVLPPSDDKGWRVIGDPTEGCLLVAAQKAGFDLPTELDRTPQDLRAAVRLRAQAHERGARRGRRAEGLRQGRAVETIPRCTRVRLDGKVVPMTDELREQIVAQNDAMSRQALRVLAVAERDLPAEMTDYTPDTVETDLTFLGLVGMIDPPRPEVGEAVEHALTAGIRIIMVTGDYGLTAEAIARRIGIVRGDRDVRVITGVELEAMSEDDLKAELGKPQDVIFARVAPEHKMQVVSALKDLGQIVAVTGDGVNDAPALKKADIGVAMGLTGTDVSREAATMILLDDSFASIIKAVEQGRGVYANVKKMVTYIFSHNMAELFPFVFAALGGVGLVPLGALQVLSIDLGSDVLPGLALGTEHPEPGVMNLPPRPRNERLLSRRDAAPRRLHRRHRVGLGRRRLPLRAALARLELGRRQLDEPRQPALPVLARGDHHDPGGDRHVPGRQRLRLPHRARVGLQGRPLQQPVPGLRRVRRHRHHRRHLLRAVPAEHLQDGSADRARLGDPGGRRRLFVLCRRSEKMVRAPA